jgi:hypothetical protein
MRRFSAMVTFAVWVGLMFAGAVSAHHSVQSQFDIHKTVTVSGDRLQDRVDQSAFLSHD